MNDAISRSVLLKTLREWPEHLGILNNPTCEEYAERYGNLEALSAIVGEVERLPALDVAPVVRCCECKYRCTQTCPMYHTEICLDDLDGFDSYDTDRTDDDGFCHLGARMDGEAE